MKCREYQIGPRFFLENWFRDTFFAFSTQYLLLFSAIIFCDFWWRVLYGPAGAVGLILSSESAIFVGLGTDSPCRCLTILARGGFACCFLRFPSVIEGENCVFRTYQLPSSARSITSGPPKSGNKMDPVLSFIFLPLLNCISTWIAFELLSNCYPQTIY